MLKTYTDTELPPETSKKRGRKPILEIDRRRFFLKSHPGLWINVGVQNTVFVVGLVIQEFKKKYPEFEFTSRGKKIFARCPAPAPAKRELGGERSEPTS